MTVKKRLTYLSPLSCLLLMASLLASCGLIDMDFDDNVQRAYDMQLDRDTVFVTQGDSFVLHPLFTPDTVSNREVFFRSSNEEIAFINGWITREKLLESAEKYGKSPYGLHLRKVADGKIHY